MNASPLRKFFGLVVAVLLTPPTIVFGAIAAFFLARQFVSGWIPSQWFSDSPLDWAFGGGVEGGANNYFGFVLSAFPTFFCYSGVLWGYNKWKGKTA